MRNFLNSRHTNYNEIGDKVDSFCEDCEKKWFPFSFLWWDDNKKNIAGIKRKDNGILVIDKILSLINSILSSIKDIYERIDVIELPIISEDTVELKNTYLEVGVTDEDFQEDLNIALYEKYIHLDENKIEKPLIESTTDNIKIVALNEQGESVYVTSNSLGKVKSVNGKIGDVVLKTSDLQNDSDYTTNTTLNSHVNNKNNPHNVTKEQLNLGDVDNTSDLNKPISTATQNALNNKADDRNVVHIDGYEVVNGEKTFTKAIVSPTYPTNDFHLTNKTYVDSKIENIETDYVLKSRRINTENGLEGGGELDRDLYIGIDSVTRTNIDKGVEGYEFSTKIGDPDSLIPDWSNEIMTKTNF